MKRIVSMVVSMVIIATLTAGSAYADTGLDVSFRDVKGSDWFAEAVSKMGAAKIIDGMPDGSFNPQGEVTRAQFIKMLVQAMEYKKIDSLSFVDLKPYPNSKPHWASVYIETALRNGVIIKGEEGERFYPDAPISREDMVMMMFRALKLEPSNGANPYCDLTEPNGCFTKVYEEYLVRGIPVNGKVIFNPTGVTTRAQGAVIIARIVEYRGDSIAFKDKMKEEEKYALTPKRLYENEAYLDGRTMKEAHEELLNDLEKDRFYIKTYGVESAEEVVKIMTDLAKGFVMADWNIDYRTVESTYAERIKPYIPYDYYNQDVPKMIKKYVDNKVVQEAYFYTSEDLVYQHTDKFGFYVRGTIKFRYNSPTKTSFLEKLNEKDNGKTIKIGQWYQEDVEVYMSGDAADPSGKLRVRRIKILKNVEPIN